ncbi:MAG: sensor histidine kinase [Anaerolineales bacterium]
MAAKTGSAPSPAEDRSVGSAVIYGGYMLIAFGWPAPLAWLSGLDPWMDYGLSALAVMLYFGTAWRTATRPYPGSRRLWTAISVSMVLLGQAQINMTLGPLWRVSWWIYHVLMLSGFLLSVGGIAIEYGALRGFRATRYFAALGSLMALGLALATGWMAASLFGVPQLQLLLVAVVLVVATVLFVALFFMVRRANGLLNIKVADDGPGIPEKERERIFDRYFRVSSTSRGGAGLGLSFCKLAVEAHMGSIWVDESAWGGAAFQIELPIRGLDAVSGREPASG